MSILPNMFAALAIGLAWLSIIGAALFPARLMDRRIVAQAFVRAYAFAGIGATAPLLLRFVIHAGDVNYFGSRLGEGVVASFAIAVFYWLCWPLIGLFWADALAGEAGHVIATGIAG